MPHPQEPRDKLIDTAEALFARKGFQGVTMRAVAAAAGIHHASIYHHAPGGKEQLFSEVTERIFRRHAHGLVAAIDVAGPSLRAQLHAVADWLLSHPPLDMVRLMHVDLPAIRRDEMHRLVALGYVSMLVPVAGALAQAQQRGDVVAHNHDLVAGGLLGMIESLHAIPEADVAPTRAQMAHTLIDVMLQGLLPRT